LLGSPEDEIILDGHDDYLGICIHAENTLSTVRVHREIPVILTNTTN
jgi:hypothetical protein